MSGLADSVVARVVKERDLLQAFDEHCRSISARVTSRDKSVSVEVDGLGAMTLRASSVDFPVAAGVEPLKVRVITL